MTTAYLLIAVTVACLAENITTLSPTANFVYRLIGSLCWPLTVLAVLIVGRK